MSADQAFMGFCVIYSLLVLSTLLFIYPRPKDKKTND